MAIKIEIGANSTQVNTAQTTANAAKRIQHTVGTQEI